MNIATIATAISLLSLTMWIIVASIVVLET